MKPSEIGRVATQGVGREAMMHEINQQILAKDKEYQLDIDTMVLWTLHQCYGWGATRLKKFYVAMMKSIFGCGSSTSWMTSIRNAIS